MPWRAKNSPKSMEHLPAAVREKAIEIDNAKEWAQHHVGYTR
jgi:uncharacterized protein YdaT